MGKIVGIDLGTTNSVISYINKGKPEIIEDENNNRIIPSVVHVTEDNEIVVGQKAKREAILQPERTVSEIKRKMGQDVFVRMGDKYYSPYEISSMIIKKLIENAENYLGEKITGAVITVPANFNDLQRSATKKAGELAGLKVERIINEPTAAALAYGTNNLETNAKVLVYDLGGGTFDVSVLDFYSGVMDVMASRGIQELGGKNFDELITDYILKDIYDSYGINLKDDAISMRRIIDESERAKIELSSVKSTEIILPSIPGDKYQKPVVYNIKFSRNKFESMISDSIDSTNAVIEEALKAAKLTDDDIDIVLAVGGSSRIPLVKNLLNKRFGDKIKTKINPDEAVALGAAIVAGIQSGEIKDSIVTDACNHSLGIEVAADAGEGKFKRGIFDPIILRDAKIPCTKKKIYTTVVDYQTKVIIKAYQGEDNVTVKNIKIAEYELPEIPPALKGEELIEVAFSYNLSQILEIKAKIISTGKCITEIINLLDPSENTRRPREDVNLEAWKDSPLAKKVEKIIEFCEKKLPDMNDKDKERVTVILNSLKQAVIDNNEELVENYDEELTNILFDLN